MTDRHTDAPLTRFIPEPNHDAYDHQAASAAAQAREAETPTTTDGTPLAVDAILRELWQQELFMASTLEITGIHHHSVIATDPVASRRFYGEKLGLKEIPSPSTFPSPVIWYACGEGQLHLMVKEDADTISPRHVALHICDAKTARDKLQAAGVETVETVCIPGADRFFVRDPDGNRIELIEWAIPWGEGEM